jgi:hypothetical protein
VLAHRRLSLPGAPRGYELRLSEGGALEVYTDQGKRRRRWGKEGPAGGYEAFLTDEGRLVVYKGDLLHHRK